MGLGQSSRSLVSNRVNQLWHSGLEYHRLHLFHTKPDTLWLEISQQHYVCALWKKSYSYQGFQPHRHSLSFSCRDYNPRTASFIWAQALSWSWPLPTECPALGTISSRYTCLELSWCCSDSHVTLLVRDVLPGRGHFLVSHQFDYDSPTPCLCLTLRICKDLRQFPFP